MCGGFQGAPEGKTKWEVAQRVQQGQQHMNLQGLRTSRKILQHFGNISFCWPVKAYTTLAAQKTLSSFPFSSLPQKKAAVVPQAQGDSMGTQHIVSSDPDEIFLQASHHCKCCF